ncbi:hypothetical protein ABKN59_007431 [Abortiporus biennis]
MFFSKLAFTGLALLGVATSAFASPVAAPEPAAELATRADSQLVTDLKSFQTTVEPLISSFGGAPADVDVLATVFADITAKVNVDVFVVADIDVVLDIVVDVVVKLVAKLGIFLNLNVNLSAQIDAFVSAFITAFDQKQPGFGKSVGAQIPISIDLNIFVTLRLVLIAKRRDCEAESAVKLGLDLRFVMVVPS